MSGNIRDRIVERRKERIAAEGHCFGRTVPDTRMVPLRPFSTSPLCICEIKRRSPSRGALSQNMDPVEQAGLYRAQGCTSISVLTEEDFFGGSLDDLMAVKHAFPDLALLRKDFLVSEDDIRVAWRAGADAILLIASMLTARELADFHTLGTSLGMEVLVEVHSAAEIDKVRPFAPPLVGINCRDLETFALDLLLPLELRRHLDWPCKVVFESGLFSRGDARFAARQDFQGILVGEAVVKRPSLVAELRQGLGELPQAGQEGRDGYFWNYIANNLAERKVSGTSRPLVKICGLTRTEDARLAHQLGADILGFVFADSPRRASLGVLEASADIPLPKVAVVVAHKEGSSSPAGLPAEVLEAWNRGLIHAVQFSGDEDGALCESFGLPFYKALRPRSPAELEHTSQFRAPRLLLDAWSATSYGGSGHSASQECIEAFKGPLWLAGGIKPSTIAETVLRWKPELVDLASGIESTPGIKSPDLMKQFFKELDHV